MILVLVLGTYGYMSNRGHIQRYFFKKRERKNWPTCDFLDKTASTISPQEKKAGENLKLSREKKKCGQRLLRSLASAWTRIFLAFDGFTDS